MPVLVRGDERLDHLGVDEVAAKLIELREPEVVAREVCVGRVVRVAAQVAEVLHQDEGAVELVALKVGVLGKLPETAARFDASAGVEPSVKIKRSFSSSERTAPALRLSFEMNSAGLIVAGNAARKRGRWTNFKAKAFLFSSSRCCRAPCPTPPL
jgi:hypothetical protein